MMEIHGIRIGDDKGEEVHTANYVDKSEKDALLSSTPEPVNGSCNPSVIDSTLALEDEVDSCPRPRFRIVGSDQGDTSVTVIPVIPPLPEGSGGSSASSSDDMKLSLVSWYSEPEAMRDRDRDVITPTCCERMTESLDFEKENRTPDLLINSGGEIGGSRESVQTLQGEESVTKERTLVSGGDTNGGKKRIHVQLSEEKNTIHSPARNKVGERKKPECQKCVRRSKSGTSTPSVPGFGFGSSRTQQASRRVMAISSGKSTGELRKPIKSILKSDSNSRSGSGSDNCKSSMDSLGSAGDSSRSGNSDKRGKSKHHPVFVDTPTLPPEDRMVSRLKRIEKYATLRFRKSSRVQPLGIGSDTDININNQGGGDATPTSDLMTKSMTFLEKAYVPRGEGPVNSTSTSSLKRQGSLRLKGKNPQPTITKTTALRLAKMQETKAKNQQLQQFGSGPASIGQYRGGGSAHSGSGESIHHNHNTHQSHSAPSKLKDSSGGIKGSLRVFAKLSSAYGQTASSNQKRLKQDKGVQTEVISLETRETTSVCLSPIQTVNLTDDLLEQIRLLENQLAKYRAKLLKIREEYQLSEKKNNDLAKQLLEQQTESNEMIEFLQAEKSTLAETLAETELEVKKWRDAIDEVKTLAESRC